MDRIARVIVERSKVFLALTALLTIISIVSLFFLTFNADISSFLMEGHEVGEEFAALQERYDSADTINVLLILDEGTFEERDALADLTLVGSKIRDVAGVESVSSLIPAEVPRTGQTLTSTMVSNAPDELLEQLVETNPAADILLSEDKTAAMIIVAPEEGKDIDVAGDLGELSWPESLEVVLTGQAIIFATSLERLTWFLLVMPPVIIALLLGTFYANIGDRKLSALSIVPAALGSLWTFATISLLGIPVDIMTVIVPIFVIVMGSADGLHFVTHYQEECARTDDVVERVRTTLRQIGTPMILTTLSTMAGFLSLLATDVHPIRQMGLLTAIGIAYAGIISFFTLPAILSHLSVEPRHKKVLLGGRLTGGIKQLARRRWFAALLTGAILVFGLVFIPQIQVDSDQLFFFKPDDEIRTSFEKMAEEFGAATPLTGEFAYDPEDSGSTERLLEIERELEELPGVTRVVSVADIARELPPEQSAELLSGEVESPFGTMVVDDGMRFMLFPGEFETEDLQAWLEFAEETEEITILTGMPVLWDEIARLVLQAQTYSLVAAFGLVFLLLLITYRNIWNTLISLVPIALTVTTLLAFISASGINLNLITAIASSIVIGVGIDYAIHLVAAIDYQKADGRPGYVARAIDKAGRPIVTNALGIAIGLTGLWLSPFLIHQHISMIMWVSMTTAALTALTVIPALMPREGMQESPSD